MAVKHPNVEVELTGRDGNAFNILGSVQHAMRKAKVPTLLRGGSL